ncbi:MAG: hypothetical protein WAO98_09380 [Alphaproteobacteria bacterium]
MKYWIFVLVLLTPFYAQADLGPKPTAAFSFTQGLKIKSGELLQCEVASCSDARPLPQLGPQGLKCDESCCHAVAYGFAPYMQLKLVLADDTERTSNIFTKKAFNATYTGRVENGVFTITEN